MNRLIFFYFIVVTFSLTSIFCYRYIQNRNVILNTGMHCIIDMSCPERFFVVPGLDIKYLDFISLIRVSNDLNADVFFFKEKNEVRIDFFFNRKKPFNMTFYILIESDMFLLSKIEGLDDFYNLIYCIESSG